MGDMSSSPSPSDGRRSRPSSRPNSSGEARPLSASPEPSAASLTPSRLPSPTSFPQIQTSISRLRSTSTLSPSTRTPQTARSTISRSSSILTNPNLPVPVVYPSPSNNLPPIPRKSSVRVKRSTSASPRIGIAENLFKEPSPTAGSPSNHGTLKSARSLRPSRLAVIQDESPKPGPDQLFPSNAVMGTDEVPQDRRRSESAPHTSNANTEEKMVGSFGTRRRGATIAQRLRDDFDNSMLPSSSSGRPPIPYDMFGRERSGSRITDDGIVTDDMERHSTIKIRFKEKSTPSRLRSESVGLVNGSGQMEGRRRAISAPFGGEERGGGSKINHNLFSNLDRMQLDDQDGEHHLDHEVDLLEVVDPTVSAVAHMTNIQNSIFAPPLSIFRRPPVVELEVPSATASEKELRLEEGRGNDDSEDEEMDLLDRHVENELTKKDQAKKILKGVWAFMKTPLGVFFTIYGILVVFWGAGLVLILIGAFDLGKYQKDLWVEIASQILNGLFTITGVGLIPWRLIDTYHIFIIWNFARRTRRRREQQNLPKLQDKNEIPMAAQYVDCQDPKELNDKKEELLSSITPTVLEDEKEQVQNREEEAQDDDELPPPVNVHSEQLKMAREELKLKQEEGDKEENHEGQETGLPLEHEASVLTSEEELKLRHAQIKFMKSQTWYNPHESATHYAFPISWALTICLLNDGNSFFQCLLCVAMWGFNRYDRPAWTTGSLIPLSFLCGIFAGILIWKGGERTKKVKEVKEAVTEILHKDREERRKRLRLPRPHLPFSHEGDN